MKLTGTGVWSHELRMGDADEVASAAGELEQLGYTALWLPQLGHDLLEVVKRVLDDTATATVATGIINVWEHTPAEVGDWWATLPPAQADRVMLAIGVGHRQAIGDAWTKPMATMNTYLDELDAAAVSASRRALAAQGPKMLALARDRSSGAHPYLVTPEHTRRAREILGPDALLAPEQKVILNSDAATARAIARENLSIYWGLTNYTDNWKRLGFTDFDIDTRSDRLVDALVAWGTPDDIAARVTEHRHAGADHVCIRVLQNKNAPMPLTIWRELAKVLT